MYIHTVGWLVIHSLAHIRIFDLGAFFIARGETLVSVPTEEKKTYMCSVYLTGTIRGYY